MDLFSILSTVRRQFALIAAVALMLTAATGLGLRASAAEYEASTRLQITAPQPEDVLVVSGNRSSNLRDDLTLARNNFVAVVRNPEVRARTIDVLGLRGKDALYDLNTQQVRDTDFVDVLVRAGDPRLAERIADTHVRESIKYYGELRARPAATMQQLIADQLPPAQQRLQQLERSGQDANPDQLRQARETYQGLLKKYDDAGLVAATALRVSHIQIIDPAVALDSSLTARRAPIYLGLTLLGGLGLGFAIAAVLESDVLRRLRQRVGYQGAARRQPREAEAPSRVIAG